MLKKISPMICSIIFIMSQACCASASTTILPNYDQIGRFQLAMILLCKMTENQPSPDTRNFIGTALLGSQWQPMLDTYTKTAHTNLSWLNQEMVTARTKAYCDLHVQARTENRQDVIDFIQHGRSS